MFDLFSWSHILILLAVALVVVGPKDLPKLMHMAGKWAGKARNLASEFKKSFDEMARQSELDELRKEIENLRNRGAHRYQSQYRSQRNPLETGGCAGRRGRYRPRNRAPANSRSPRPRP